VPLFDDDLHEEVPRRVCLSLCTRSRQDLGIVGPSHILLPAGTRVASGLPAMACEVDKKLTTVRVLAFTFVTKVIRGLVILS